MSSIFSTQKRHTFLRRKYCFLVAIALSPPVGLCDALMGRPPLVSAIIDSFYLILLLLLDRSTGRRSPGPRTAGFRRPSHDMLGRRQARRGYWYRRLPGCSFFPLLLALCDFFQFL